MHFALARKEKKRISGEQFENYSRLKVTEENCFFTRQTAKTLHIINGQIVGKCLIIDSTMPGMIFTLSN